MLAALKGWRMVIINTLTALPATILAVLDALKSDMVDLQALLPPERSVKIIAAMGVINVILRIVTTGPVGTKQ